MLTEAHIRRALDGTFTRWTHSGETVTKAVPRGFVPEYDAQPKKRVIKQPGVGSGRYKRGERKPWTPEQDAMLLELRRAGVSILACTGIVRRGIKQVRVRLRELNNRPVAA